MIFFSQLKIMLVAEIQLTASRRALCRLWVPQPSDEQGRIPGLTEEQETAK